MMLKSQRRIAAIVLSCSIKKVRFDPDKLPDIKEAITKEDIKTLVEEGTIKKIRSNHQSRVRARMRKIQRSKGRQRGVGSRKGTPHSRLSKKQRWIGRIRLQRAVLQDLKKKKEITTSIYRDLYLKSKGGFFRSKRHLELYVDEHKLKGQK